MSHTLNFCEKKKTNMADIVHSFVRPPGTSAARRVPQPAAAVGPFGGGRRLGAVPLGPAQR